MREAVAEAESRPLAFPAKERAAYVRARIVQIEELKREGKTAEQIRSQVPEFARDYAELFKAVCAPEGYDKQSLSVMLAMLDRMGEGNMTQHQASVIVGKKLLDKIVKPQLNGSGSS